MPRVKIYEDQIAVLGEARSAEFERRLLKFVSEKVATRTNREVRASDVRALVAEAGAHSLDTERQIAAYVVGAWTFGDDFRALIEPMRETLGDGGVAPDTKATMILEAFDSLWLPRPG